jgi:hypothetical protein
MWIIKQLLLSFKKSGMKLKEQSKMQVKNSFLQKKIGCTSKPIYKNKGHTPSFKDLRKVTKILSLVKRVQKGPSSEMLDEIERKTDKLAKTYRFLISKLLMEPWTAQRSNGRNGKRTSRKILGPSKRLTIERKQQLKKMKLRRPY